MKIQFDLKTTLATFGFLLPWAASAWMTDLPYYGDRELNRFDGTNWVSKSEEEIAVVLAARQAAKPLERKVAENTYLTLCATALGAAGDERATNVPPAKLTFPELAEVMDTIQSNSVETAILLTLQMLAADAALKRYDLLWWEDAQWHPEIVAP